MMMASMMSTSVVNKELGDSFFLTMGLIGNHFQNLLILIVCFCLVCFGIFCVRCCVVTFVLLYVVLCVALVLSLALLFSVVWCAVFSV